MVIFFRRSPLFFLQTTCSSLGQIFTEVLYSLFFFSFCWWLEAETTKQNYRVMAQHLENQSSMQQPNSAVKPVKSPQNKSTGAFIICRANYLRWDVNWTRILVTSSEKKCHKYIPLHFVPISYQRNWSYLTHQYLLRNDMVNRPCM